MFYSGVPSELPFVSAAFHAHDVVGKFVEGSFLSSMNGAQMACRLHHGLGLFAVGHVSNVNQSAVVVLSVKAAQYVLVVPCEIGKSHQTGI